MLEVRQEHSANSLKVQRKAAVPYHPVSVSHKLDIICAVARENVPSDIGMRPTNTQISLRICAVYSESVFVVRM